MSYKLTKFFSPTGPQRGEAQKFDKLTNNPNSTMVSSKPTNSAMVSSKPNSARASSSRSNSISNPLPVLLTPETASPSSRVFAPIPFTTTNLKLPPRVTPALKLAKPTKRKQSELTSKEDEPNPDDDFKEAPPPDVQLVVPKKKIRNPFPALDQQRQTFDSNSRFVRTDDDFIKPPKSQPITKLLKPEKRIDKRAEKEKEQLFNKLEAEQNREDRHKGKKKCPYCAEILFPMVPEVEKALKTIILKDKEHRKMQTAQMEKENSTSSYSKPLDLITKRPVSNSEKDKFCSLHNKELIIKPDGIQKGYPTTIDFSAIESRIGKFDGELKDIICNKIRSDYRMTAENAYKEQGTTKARSVMSVLNRFEATLPGYYGPKGSATILDALSKRYLQTGYLQRELVSPQLPLEFLQQVLVPEAGFRLIRQDMIRKQGPGVNNLTGIAKTVMADSCEFGNAMFPVEEADIEDDEIIIPPTLVLSDESDEEKEEEYYASDHSEY